MLSKKKGGVEITVDDTTFWVQPSISGSDIQDGLKLLRSLNRIQEAVKVATSSIPSLEKMNQLDILAKKYETEFNDEAAFHFTGLFFLHIFKNDYIPFLQLEEIGPSLIDYYFENLPKESVKSDKLLNDVKTRTDLFNGVIEQLGFNYINNGFMEEAETVLETLKKIHSEKYHVLKSRLRSVTHYVLPLTKLTKWIGSEAIVSVNGQVHQTEDGDLFLYMEKNKSYSIELDFGSQKTMQGGFSTDNDANIAKLKSWEISNELQTGLKTETESRVLATSNGYDREYCRQMALQNAAPQLLEFIKEESVTVQDANGISTKKVEGKLKNSSMEESTYQLHKRGDIYEFFAIFSAPFNQE